MQRKNQKIPEYLEPFQAHATVLGPTKTIFLDNDELIPSEYLTSGLILLVWFTALFLAFRSLYKECLAKVRKTPKIPIRNEKILEQLNQFAKKNNNGKEQLFYQVEDEHNSDDEIADIGKDEDYKPTSHVKSFSPISKKQIKHRKHFVAPKVTNTTHKKITTKLNNKNIVSFSKKLNLPIYNPSSPNNQVFDLNFEESYAFINPFLLKFLAEYASYALTILVELLKRHKIIEGNSKGQDGILILNKDKKVNESFQEIDNKKIKLDIKIKKAKEDFRFGGVLRYTNRQDQSLYEINALKLHHKNKNWTFFKARAEKIEVETQERVTLKRVGT